MAIKPILQDGDPILDAIAIPIPEELFGTAELTQIIADMTDTLDQELDGVALAAPQIGVPYRIFIVRYDRTIPPPALKHSESAEQLQETVTEHVADIGVFINPEFIRSSRKREEMEEGCLSVRGMYGTTFRHERATVRARTEDGKMFERGGGGLLAQIFQHETDHLNGILFVDHAIDLVRVKRSAPHEESTENLVPFVFFGTPYVASDTLEILKSRGYVPSLIVTSPDRPRGRGLKMSSSETKEWALENGVPVLTPEKITEEVIEEIITMSGTAAGGSQYGLVAAYGKILPKALIDSFPLGILNIHYSLLPKYRGASPVESALLAGDAVTGVAIQQMVPALDAGDIIALEEVPITEFETTRGLRPRLVTIGAHLLADILPAFVGGEITHQPQDATQATTCKKISKEDGLLDLQDDSKKNWNKYRAYAESPGTYFFVEKGERKIRVKITQATFKDGAFVVERVTPEGKSEQSYTDFLSR
jgi:methionyl-tRNA formyltransferase